MIMNSVSEVEKIIQDYTRESGVRELDRQIIYQRHAKILPFRGTGACDIAGEILFRHMHEVVRRIFLGETVPIGIAALHRELVRVVEFIGQCA